MTTFALFNLVNYFEKTSMNRFKVSTLLLFLSYLPTFAFAQAASDESSGAVEVIQEIQKSLGKFMTELVKPRTDTAAGANESKGAAQSGGDVFIPFSPSKIPNAWTDFAYTPANLNGSMHLRIGRSGVTNFSGIGNDSRLTPGAKGLYTCDLNYLYHAKNGSFPNKDELEWCVRLEEVVRVAAEGNPKDLNNSFVWQETVNTWVPKIKARMELMRGHTRFYFRADTVNLEPYDTNTQSFRALVFLGGMQTTSYRWEFIDHAFVGKSVDSIGNAAKFQFSPGEQVARDLEFARSKGLVDYRATDVHFTLNGVSQRPVRDKYNIVRAYEVSDIKWSLPFLRSDGVRTILTLAN